MRRWQLGKTLCNLLPNNKHMLRQQHDDKEEEEEGHGEVETTTPLENLSKTRTFQGAMAEEFEESPPVKEDEGGDRSRSRASSWAWRREWEEEGDGRKEGGMGGGGRGVVADRIFFRRADRIFLI